MTGAVVIEAAITDVGTGSIYEIDDMIVSMDFDLNAAEDDLAVFKLDTNKWWSDDEQYEYIRAGNTITFRFGYTDYISEWYTMKIMWTDLSISVKGQFDTIRCMPHGTVMKHNTSDKIWRNVTMYDIAQEIAARYGLRVDLDKTTIVHKSLAQGNRNDMSFLRYVASLEPKKYQVHITSNTLHIKQIGIYKKAFYFFDAKDDNTAIVSIRLTHELVTKRKGHALQSYTKDGEGLDVDALTNDAVDAVSGTGQQLLNNMGNFIHESLNDKETIDRFSEQPIKKTAFELLQGGFNAGEKVMQSVSTTWQQSNLLKNMNTDKKIKELVAKLVVIGCPLYWKDEMITLLGIRRRFEGNYYVQGVRHNISAEREYLTTFNLNRNGIRRTEKADRFDKIFGDLVGVQTKNDEEGMQDPYNTNNNTGINNQGRFINSQQPTTTVEDDGL